MTNWQPIETAPKDGEQIVLAKYGWVYPQTGGKKFVLWWLCDGHWSSRFENWNDGIEPSGLAGPTHWMPLPEPPND